MLEMFQNNTKGTTKKKLYDASVCLLANNTRKLKMYFRFNKNKGRGCNLIMKYTECGTVLRNQPVLRDATEIITRFTNQ